MIITIDGIDGAGKSTLAKNLANNLNFEYVDKPIYELFGVKGDDNYLYNEIYHIQDAVYNKTDSNTLKSWFTGMSLLYIKEMMSGKNIIIDRGLLSAYAFNGDKQSEIVFNTLIKLGVWFDLSIILTVSSEERIKRLKKRNPNDPDLSLDKVMNLQYNTITQFISNHNDLPFLMIDTDSKSPEEILNIVLDEIDNFEKLNNDNKGIYRKKLRW